MVSTLICSFPNLIQDLSWILKPGKFHSRVATFYLPIVSTNTYVNNQLFNFYYPLLQKKGAFVSKKSSRSLKKKSHVFLLTLCYFVILFCLGILCQRIHLEPSRGWREDHTLERADARAGKVGKRLTGWLAQLF